MIGLEPIQMLNGCSEAKCQLHSNDTDLTNTIRHHYLVNFGHRLLDSMIDDYSPNAVLHHIVNGEYSCYKGKEEIRKAFQEIFDMHVVGSSTFNLEHVIVDKESHMGMAVWSGSIPGKIFPQSNDTFYFDENGKIESQMFFCTVVPKK